MKGKSSVAMLRLVGAILPLLLTGCQTVEKYSLTHQVWDNGDWPRFSKPAPNPNLALFETTHRAEVLVLYDALSGKRSTIKRQAYYLERNQGRIAAGNKPKLVRPSVADGMKTIAVLPAQGALTNLSPGLSAYALVGQEGHGFTLYRPAEPPVTFDFPVYAETSGTAARILSTPFAVAGDTVMVGAVATVVGFFLWIESGLPMP